MAGFAGDIEEMQARILRDMLEIGELLGIRMTVLHANGCCALAPPSRWQRCKSFLGLS